MDLYPRALVGRWKVETGEHLEAHRPASALFTVHQQMTRWEWGLTPEVVLQSPLTCYSMRASAHPHTHGHAHMYVAQTHTHITHNKT